MTLKKFIKPIIISSILPLSCSANASSFNESFYSLVGESTETDYNYAGIRGGAVFPQKTEGDSDLQSVSGDTTYTVGASIGRKFMDRFGVELEYMHRGHSDINSSSTAGSTKTTNTWGVEADTFLLNATADLLTCELIRPYVKFGAGFSRNKADQYTYLSGTRVTTWNGSNNTEFAWQAAFGINLATTKTIDTNFEYAFIDRGKFKTQTGSITTVNGGDAISNASSTAKTGYLREQVLTIGIKMKF